MKLPPHSLGKQISSAFTGLPLFKTKNRGAKIKQESRPLRVFGWSRPAVTAAVAILALGTVRMACATAPDYIVTTTTGATIVPGTTDIGNHCDDCPTGISLPFPVKFYDQTFTSVNVWSNGNLEFTGAGESCCTVCMPSSSGNNLISPSWTDLYTANASSGQGIFISVSGTAPNRIFNIEWRTEHCCSGNPPSYNFEVRLYEAEDRIDFVYGISPNSDFGGIGVQRDTGSQSTTVSCHVTPAAGTQYTFTPACFAPPTQMVSWWPAEGNAIDIQGGHDGTLQNGTTFGPGKVRHAFSFDGIDDFVSAGNPSAFQFGTTQPFSVDAWVYYDSLGDPNDPHSYCGSGIGCDMEIVRKGPDNSDGWMLLKQADNRFWVCLGGGCSPDDPHTVVSTTVAVTGTWYHVAMVRGATEFAIYVNGVKEGAKPIPPFDNSDSAGLNIGKVTDGRVDEVEVFNRALSDSEVAGIYLADSAGKCRSTAPACHKIAFATNRDANYEIYVMNADGSSQTRLTNDPAADYVPSFSADGSKIAFTSTRDGNAEIYIMNADGSNQTRLTNNTGDDFNPSFSADGSKIAFTSTRDGNGEIYVINADGSNETRLTINTVNDLEPSFSGDGSKIAFSSSRDGNSEIYVMNADGSNQTRLTNNAANDNQSSFSVDGGKIAFTSSRDGNFEIYVMNADGSNQTRLTNNAANDVDPSFSPDGSKIAFMSTRDGNDEIYVMNADGSNQTRLSNNSASDANPSFGGCPPPPCDEVTFYRDADGDNYGDPNVTTQACTAPDGYVSDNSDCDDTNAAVNPGAAEVCDGLDNNCDGQTDEGVTTTFYRDADGDNYGDPNNTTEACSPPDGYVSDNTDCDDSNAAVNPGATEVCNGIDDDCDAQTPDGSGDPALNDNNACTTDSCTDGSISHTPVNTDDGDACTIDTCDPETGVHHNPVDPTTWYQDADSDSFGNPGVSVQSCFQPAGYVTNNTDCNDTNAAVHPGAIEACDGIDNNCNGTTDEGCSTPTPTPTPTPAITGTEVDGSGSITVSGGQATFSMNVGRDRKRRVKGSFTYRDPAANLSFSSNKISNFSITGNQAQFSGTAKLGRRSNISFTVNVTDNGMPGTLDTFSITTSSHYSASGNLTDGDLRIH